MAASAWKPDSLRWQMAEPYGRAAEIGRRFGAAPLLGHILHNRGIDDPDAAAAFLRPRPGEMHDPSLLGGAEDAARRLARAVADGRRIVVYGDYDVDGIAGVAILLTGLRLAGGQASYYVPHRLEEGYGVNEKAVEKLLAEGADVLVTVDCGISAAGPLAQAQARGAEIIVTDHHGLPESLPPADVIVHPALPEASYPNPDLAGAGVALKLAWQFAREVCGSRRVDPAWKAYLTDATCLAALGTVADVVPLVGENRALAAFGLRGLPGSEHPGLKALLASAGLTGEKLDAYHIGFVLAPRLNACGRMGHARLAVELLTDVAGPRAAKIADYLAKQNAERQRVEREIAQQATTMVEQGGLADDAHRAIVLASDTWHSGVIGIVASRLVRRFHRPALLIAVNGRGAQGSGRSIRGFHMRDALAACAEHLISFGGHAMAGGLRIEPERIPAFTEAMLAYAAENVTDEQLVPSLRIDAEATLRDLSFRTVSALARLAPFGQGNPRPVVALRGCEVVVAPRRMGRNGATAGLVLGQDGVTMRAVGFGMGALADRLAAHARVDVAGEPSLNTFRGETRVEFILRDVRA